MIRGGKVPNDLGKKKQIRPKNRPFFAIKSDQKMSLDKKKTVKGSHYFNIFFVFLLFS